MSFATPAALVGLIIIPAAIFWYVRQQQARRRAAAAFVTPQLAASVVPDRPGWRRHAPMLAVAVAIGVLVLAAARPQRTVAVPVERASIMLATDVSGSMLATDVQPSRLVAARRAAAHFVDSVPKQVNVGVLAFNQTPTVLQGPTRDREAITTALNRMHSSGATATGDAIKAATGLLNRASAGKTKKPPAAILLLSDGKSTRGSDPMAAARAAGKLKIPVYTVALGTASGTIHSGTKVTPVPPDPSSLAQIAQLSGGQAFTAANASGLSAVYKHLGSQLGREHQKKELTAGFAGGAMVLLLLGALMSLRWFGRPI